MYMLLGVELYFYSVRAEYWVVLVYRICNCHVSPYDDGYRIFSLHFCNKITSVSFVVVMGWLSVCVCASSIALSVFNTHPTYQFRIFHMNSILISTKTQRRFSLSLRNKCSFTFHDELKTSYTLKLFTYLLTYSMEQSPS